MATLAGALQDEILGVFADYVIPNYTRYPTCLSHGEGSEVWDVDGNRYLDFFPGWGCNLIGHCPPRVVDAVREQVGRLIHVPNTWYTEAQGRFAQALVERAFPSQAFFCNSGTEANEAAIKLARLKQAPRYKIITALDSFHGRTFASLSATGQPKYQAGVGPLLPGFRHAPFGSADAVRKLIDDETAAIMVEPVQGEGGVNVPGDNYLADLRQMSDDHRLLLIFDEVQSGMGRTGKWFAHQNWGVTPDIMTLAKALAGGVACGAMLAKPDVATSLRPGTHAATFGGNPIACVAGMATIETIEADDLLSRAKVIESRFRSFFENLQRQSTLIRDVRVLGAFIGIDLATPAAPVVAECLKRRLLVNATHDTVLRLLPALNIPDAQIDEGLAILGDVLGSLAGAR